MPSDPLALQDRPDTGQDPAENRTESVADGPSVDPDRFTAAGEEAEYAAFWNEGAYGGAVSPVDRSSP